jgi:hypothetical protein
MRPRYDRDVRGVAIVLVLAGCGRIGFDERSGSDGGGSSGGDGGGSSVNCVPRTSAPDPIVITGTTFRYTSYDNSMRVAIASTNLTAIDRASGDPLGFTTSGAGGFYTLLVATGGVPVSLQLSYSATNYYESMLTIDRAVDRDVAGAGLPVWTIGDGPLWNAASMTAIYMLAGVAPGGATINVAVRDCAGNPLEGATIDIQPPPEKLMYQASDGMPVNGTETVSPFAHALAFNAQTGNSTITVTKPGLTFQPLIVDVPPGTINTLVVIHAD